jgi:hypothetical protein
MDRTTAAGTVAAVGIALAGSGLTEIAPAFITELVPMWARQTGALMFIIGTVLASKFALDASAIRQIALKPEERNNPPSESPVDSPTANKP